MNGVHDMGGMHGYGPVCPEAHEPQFHGRWESRVLGLNLALRAGWNIDASRHARESLPPAIYLNATYYEIWLRGLERLLLDHGLIDEDELASGQLRRSPKPGYRILRAEDVAGVIRKGSPYSRSVEAAPGFAPGQFVRARNLHPQGHTRLPGYVRGHVGVVEQIHGGFVFPDTNAHYQGEHPQWCYSVRFTGAELWGVDADPATSVMVDCFEPYLETA